MPKVTNALAAVSVDRIGKGGDAAYALATRIKGAETTVGKPVWLADGSGLYLLVEPTGAARWMFTYRWGGKTKEMGLGGLSDANGLKVAREKAHDARQLLARGLNPLEERRVKRGVPTFGEVADEMLEDLAPTFRNPKHAASWERAIGAPRAVKQRDGFGWRDAGASVSFAHALRDKPVDQITTDDVYRVLKPLWSTTHETASRLRGQIERVLDRAKARKLRTGENPAAWNGNLKHLLPARRKLTKGHRPALPYAKLPEFMQALRGRAALSALALEFTILTAARAGEVLGARWEEIDFAAELWTVPAERMKGGKTHRVPLSGPAMDLLRRLALLRSSPPIGLIFSGSGDRPLSEASMMACLKRMGVEDVTVHGFRSTFRDWAGDATSFPRDLAESALAHSIANEVEAAYRRSDALDRRRVMMEAWADFCGRGPIEAAKVVPFVARG